MPIYNVLAEGWLTNARGHGAHYTPARKGRKPITIEMSEGQATYLLASGQIGLPDAAADTVDDTEEAAAIDAQPPVVAVSDGPTPGEPEELTSFRNKRPR